MWGMNWLKSCSTLAASAFLMVTLAASVTAKTVQPTPTPAPSGPPAPTLAAPANGAAVAQPITLAWNPVISPGTPIVSYTWQVAATSAFTTIIATGFTGTDSDPTIPTPTKARVSGLPNGTYFWRVQELTFPLHRGRPRRLSR